MAVLIFVQTAPPLWYCCHMSSCHHALSPTLPPLGSLVRVLWYGGDPTGSGETWIRRCPLRELEVLEQ